MNFSRRAIRYLTRKKTKTVILFLIFLIAETLILSTTSILRASEDAKCALREKTKTKVIVDVQDEKNLIKEDDIEAIQRLDGIQKLNTMAKVWIYPTDFQLITSSDDTSKKKSSSTDNCL